VSEKLAEIQPKPVITNNFNLTDKIPIFNYLVISERVGYHRTIMRFFLSQHREFYRYQLTANEIWEVVRKQFDPLYTLEKCQNDLRSLEDWGNLITTYDASRHTSIQSFRSPSLLYQATPLAIAVETFLEQQQRVGISAGALRQGDIARLWEIIERVNVLLIETINTEITPTQSQKLADEWRQAFDLFNTIAREAAQYLGNLIAVARNPRTSLEAYQSYKRAVVEYVTNFGQTLAHYSVAFREMFAVWRTNDYLSGLIQIITDHLEPPTLEEERRQPYNQLLREAGNQVRALSDWFAVGKSADAFRRTAMAEVEKVVRRAEQFAASARPNANYATDLDRLARRLLEATSPEESKQLLLVAFAHALPAHLPENLAQPTGTSGTYEAWREVPTVNPILRALGRNTRERGTELPINQNFAAQKALIEERMRQRREEQERFAALFAAGALNVGEVWLNSPADRAALMAVVRGCLRDSRFQFQAPDGSFIVLLNPQEKSYGLLRAPDGSVLMPRYQLKRHPA
jgi:uncharacterized protein (TIGR02677 family)